MVHGDQNGNLSSEVQTTWFGWDGDRLTSTEKEGGQSVHTVYHPGSFVPLVRLEGQAQAKAPDLPERLEQTHQFKLDPNLRPFFKDLELKYRQTGEIEAESQQLLTQAGVLEVVQAALQEKPPIPELSIHQYVTDHLGTPMALINEQGKADWQISLDPWGNVIDEQNQNELYQPIRMQGQHFDEESGLHYNRYRYYEPNSGRYITQDPIGLRGGTNVYQYPNNPINDLDPLGLEKLKLEEVEKHIKANNNSGLSDGTILCLIWKETNFDPNVKNKKSTATGLMQMTVGAIEDVNSKTNAGTFKHSDMTDPDKAIAAGTAYLALRIKWSKKSIEKGLNGFGTGEGFSDDILECGKCVEKANKSTPTGCKTDCLEKIHK